MRTEKIIWGLVLVFTGSILLLQNLEVIHFNWHVIFRFWPVILILIGANLVFSRDDSSASAGISLILTLLTLGFLTYKGITTPRYHESYWSYNHNDDDDDDEQKLHSGMFTEEYHDSISRATLNISGGATQYVLRDTTSSLFQADVRDHFGDYSLFRTSADSSNVLNFKMNSKSNWKLKDQRNNKAIIKLNTMPVWDINVEMGAGTTRFDLTPFKISNLHIEGGAASFKIKLGQPVKKTHVSVETGVSEIEISIPDSVACKINIESGLSSNDFKGFIKREDGSFTTENYDESSKAIVLNLEGGLSKFRVKRYSN